MTNQSPDPTFLKVAQGVHHFQQEIYRQKQTLFNTLAKKQDPKILFITCSDSRINPALITQTEPGDMFLVSNAGNIIPPHGTVEGGTYASIVFALTILNVEHVILCGHSNCGAMEVLTHPLEELDHIPDIKNWLTFAAETKALLDAETKSMTEEERMDYCVHMNIPVQLANLKTLPLVSEKISQNTLTLHGWVYDIGSGKIEVYHPESQRFIAFNEAYPIAQNLVASH